MLDKADTGIHIGISTEVIFLTVNGCICTSVITGTVAVACAGRVNYPSTHSRAICIKGILNTVYSLFADIKLIVRTCIAVAFVSGLPTLLELVVDRIVQVTIHFKDTCAGLVNLAASLVGANELTVNDHIVVSDLDLGNDSSPINYGLTGLAVGSVLVTCFSGGCFFVKNYKLCIVNVVGRLDVSQFGCNIDFTGKGRSGLAYSDLTVNNFTFNVYSRLISAAYSSIELFSQIVITVICPYTNRNAYKSIIKSLCLGSINEFNSNSKEFCDLVIVKSSLIAICDNSALGFPSICGLELQGGYQFGNFRKICNIDIYIVDGLRLSCFTGIVMTGKLNNCITCNRESADEFCWVTKFVLNLKGNSMLTRNKGNIPLSRESISYEGRFYFNTIDTDFTAGKVKRCVVCNGCRECNFITADNITILQIPSDIIGRIGRIGNGRKNSVVNSRAVVKSDIINIESYFVCNLGLCIGTNECR